MSFSLQGDPETSEEDKTNLISAHELEDLSRHDSRAVTPQVEAYHKLEGHANRNGFLSAPLSGPIRPLSPDTLSNLSVEEYEQLHPSRPQSRDQGQDGHIVHLPALPPPRRWRGKLRGFYVRNLGLGYMLLAQVFGTMMNVTTRLLEVEGNNGKGMHPFQILFARMGITFVLASGYMWYKGTKDFPLGMREVRWLLAARGFGGFFGVFGMYYSLLYLPLADATVMTFLSPSLACWACSILINEPFGRIEQLAGLISLGGVLLIAKPATLLAVFGSNGESAGPPPANGSSDVVPAFNGTMSGVGGSGGDASNYDNVTPSQRLFAVGVALLGVLGGATAFTTIRWIGKRAHPLISVNYFAAWCTLVSTVMMLALPDVGFLLPANLKDWGYLFFLGTCGFIMQFLLAAGLAYEKSSRATNITYTQMLFALGSDKIFFNHTPDVMSIAGSALILGSAVYVATMADSGRSSVAKQHTEDGLSTDAELEAQQGLISARGDVESGEDHDRLPLQEIQLRTLR